MKTIFTAPQLNEAVQQLAAAINAHHTSLQDVVFIGVQQGGVVVADAVTKALQQLRPNEKIQYGQLDITFYRDDIRSEILAPDTMNIPFNIENKQVVLIDDVLFTGRTIKAALDALLDLGRPAKVELCVLVDRREHRQFPIQADYVAKTVTTQRTDKIKLINGEVVLKP